MDNEFAGIVKGALLHDIGKVVQRAQDNPIKKKHTQWGYDWMKENGVDDSIALSAIAHHYEKDDDYALNNNKGLIWYQSDNLSSSERKGKEKLEEAVWHSQIAIASPFSKINNPNNLDKKPPLTYLPLIQDNQIDETLSEEPVYSKDAYKRILDAFEEDFNSNEVPKPHSINFLLMLFEKHFSSVPSITLRIYEGLKREEIKGKHPDISFYDHSKLAAAIAGCMYHYYKETYQEKWNNNELLKDEILNVPKENKPYLLIGGDISGVQRFIYTITSKGALKSLKGRSFYLELLSEYIISELIEALRLTRCNLIFSGGGHFYILSHNTASAEVAVNDLKAKIDEYLFEEYKGSLQLHIAYEGFHPDEFSNASGLWSRLSEKLERAKRTKWPHRLYDVLKVEMPHDDCLTQYCEVCFREDLPLNELYVGDENLSVCAPCKTQYELGEALKRISKGKSPVLYRFDSVPEDYTIKINNAYYLLKTGWDKSIHQDAKEVFRINDFTAKHYSHPASICLLIGLYQHEKLHELLDVRDVFGINRVAVLRMDVDNLGKIFSQAVPKEDRTFSRMASISRRLNKFFRFYLNGIVEGKAIDAPTDVTGRSVKTKGRMLSVVYAGGDDLFLIGHWLDVTEAAFDINKCFKRYTGNPFLTISGGIALNHEKYPVYQYAKDAAEAEDQAKIYKAGHTPKNAITLFGSRVFKWDKQSAEKVLGRVKFFTKFLLLRSDHLMVDEGKLPKTFYYRLLALARRFNENGILVLPKAAYLVSRAITDKCNPEDILELKEVVMKHDKEEWGITETATMWTLMLMRKGGGENV
jgi:CRISPR-associated protein Csm1